MNEFRRIKSQIENEKLINKNIRGILKGILSIGRLI